MVCKELSIWMSHWFFAMDKGKVFIQNGFDTNEIKYLLWELFSKKSLDELCFYVFGIRFEQNNQINNQPQY